jgi:hypothetical protein
VTDAHADARLVVAFVGEDDALDHVAAAAARIARASGARVILYDRDAASLFSDPLPNEWASEAEGAQFGDPLSDQDLVRLGREPLARKVAAARQDGVDAWAWLASGHGTDKAVDYAREHGADLLLLPQDLDDPGLAERLRGQTVAKAVQEADDTGGGLTVLLVAADGSVAPAAGGR